MLEADDVVDALGCFAAEASSLSSDRDSSPWLDSKSTSILELGGVRGGCDGDLFCGVTLRAPALGNSRCGGSIDGIFSCCEGEGVVLLFDFWRSRHLGEPPFERAGDDASCCCCCVGLDVVVVVVGVVVELEKKAGVRKNFPVINDFLRGFGLLLLGVVVVAFGVLLRLLLDDDGAVAVFRLSCCAAIVVFDLPCDVGVVVVVVVVFGLFRGDGGFDGCGCCGCDGGVGVGGVVVVVVGGCFFFGGDDFAVRRAMNDGVGVGTGVVCSGVAIGVGCGGRGIVEARDDVQRGLFGAEAFIKRGVTFFFSTSRLT